MLLSSEQHPHDFIHLSFNSHDRRIVAQIDKVLAFLFHILPYSIIKYGNIHIRPLADNIANSTLHIIGLYGMPAVSENSTNPHAVPFRFDIVDLYAIFR